MNWHSLRFKLLAWFSTLLLLVVVLFGMFTYGRIEALVVEEQRAALAHRAEQIAGMLEGLKPADENSLGNRVEARFAPSLNEKFVRVTRGDGRVVYRSGEPASHAFDPAAIDAKPLPQDKPTSRREHSTGDAGMLIASLPARKGAFTYTIEVGGPLAETHRLLKTVLLTLGGGLPVLLALAIAGGYVLIGRALRPVQDVMNAAQEITLSQLSRRLPVPASQDELAHLAVALNQMIARLDESFQNTSRFTADASHELRTPLAIMRGELEALLSSPTLPAEARNDVASILEETERLVHIVEGLFAITRLDTGEARNESVPVDLADLAVTTADQMCLLAEVKHVALRYDAPEKAEVLGDRSRLKQVIVNLLDNAIKYTPEGGEVSLQVSVKNGSALLDISDNGPGVPEAALPHLFKRFYRAEEVRSRETGGAGLGLSIVQSICTAHGGTVAVRNRAPSGFAVTVTLPRLR